MLELHEFQVPRHQIEPVKVSPANNVRERALCVIIANSSIERLVGNDVYFRQDTEQRRQARLWIKIDGKDAIALQRQMLRKMSGSGGLAAPTFKIRDSQYLKMLTRTPMRHEFYG